MSVELAAVRVLAPWFGASTAVWTNVIGVVLLALAIGYSLGARASSRARSPARALGLSLVVASVLAALVPLLSGPLARMFLPARLTLEQAGSLLSWGSLATSVCLFLPAALALGCVAPLCVEVLARSDHRAAGAAGGLVLCASTLGSLLGTFATTYVLVPGLGTTRTFVLASLVLAVLGVIALWGLAERDRSRVVALVALIAPLGLASTKARMPELPEGSTLLAAAESQYQSLRVVERIEDGEAVRFLQVNESFDSYQSVWTPSLGLLGDPYYYNCFVYPLWWSPDVRDWRVGVVGLGGGTAWRVLEGARPAGTTLSLEGAEIDGTLLELAHAWLELPSHEPRCRVLAGVDGRKLVESRVAAYELLVLDAYANQTEIPPHLASVEFFRAARASLVPNGWLVANVGGFDFDDPVVDAVASTLAAAFGQRVLALRVPFSRNFALFARRDAEPCDPCSASWRTNEAEIDRRLSSPAVPGNHRWFEVPTLAVLSDDRNPIQELQRRSIERAALRGGP